MVGGGRSPVEPVCGAKIPANRDNNREFLKKRPPRPKTARQTHDSSVGYKEIPYRPEQGINSSEQGKLRAFRAEQGISGVAILMFFIAGLTEFDQNFRVLKRGLNRR